MIKNTTLLGSLPKVIPIEHVSFDAALIKELKTLNIIKPHRKCVHMLKINNNLEVILRDRIKKNIKEACFQYGQLLFLNKMYEDAIYYFNLGASKYKDLQCMYQIGVMYYDGLKVQVDAELACGYMKQILDFKDLPEARHLIYAAAFNLGRAYYMGFGVKQSVEKALEYWHFAADDGSPVASVYAQTMLGYFYSHEEHIDIAKAIFWHSEACSNGSAQSQAVLGVMYFLGIGKKVDFGAALLCLRHASERGVIYAQGMLCFYYYSRKLYFNAADLSARIISTAPSSIGDSSDSMRKGLALAYFIYARCLNLGYGVQKNSCLSQLYSKKSYAWNVEISLYFKQLVGIGQM